MVDLDIYHLTLGASKLCISLNCLHLNFKFDMILEKSSKPKCLS